MNSGPDDVERSKREVEAAQARAARDAQILNLADTVIQDSRAVRKDNHWTAMVRDLFRG